MVRMNFIFNLINLAAVEKTKRKKLNWTPGLYWHESEKNWVGSVSKTKNKKNSGLMHVDIYPNKLSM